MIESPAPYLIVLPRDASEPIHRGVDRLRSTVSSLDVSRHDPESDGQTVIALQRDRVAEDGDAWSLTTPHRDRIELRAGSDRGLMYACYRLAEAIALDEPLASLAGVHAPRVPRRMAMLSAMLHFGAHFRPDVYRRTLDELPALGLNMVSITVSRVHASSVGSPPLPVSIDHEGRRQINAQDLAAWRSTLAELKLYGLDTVVTIASDIPASISRDDLVAWYAGDQDLDAVPETIHRHMSQLLDALYDLLPDLDGVILHSLECESVWYNAASPFPAPDPERASAGLAAYLQALHTTSTRRGKFAGFWTHISAIPPIQARRLRAIVAELPDLLLLEDAHWPNAGWPFLPFVGYLPDDLRRDALGRRRVGISLTTTDGEYYGAGSLPSVDPAPFAAAADAAVALDVELVAMRLNQMDRTPYGTLFGMNGTMPTVAAARLWSPPAPIDATVTRWCRLRFGEAAPIVEQALAAASDVLHDGFTFGGLNLLDHSGIAHHQWTPTRGQRNSRFDLFADPGRPLATASFDELTGADYPAWQMQATARPISEFRDRQTRARQRNMQAIACLESARHLAPEPIDVLLDAFRDAALVLHTLLLLGEMAAAANRLIDGHTADLATVCDSLTRWADELERQRGTCFLPTIYLMSVPSDTRPIPYSPLVPTIRHLLGLHRRLLPVAETVSP